MTDISPEAVEREICNPIISHVADGRGLSERRLASIIDTARALSARVAELEAEVANTRAAMPAPEVTVAEAAEVVVRYLESEYRTISYEESTHLSAQKHKEFTAYLYAVSHLRALTGDNQ